jgi:ketosteroid isomerase-like protein
MSEGAVDPAAERAAAVVRRYLAALAEHDWPALAATLAPDVERMGPYGDVHRGREPYAAFLADTLRALAGYELQLARLVATADVVVAELSETVDTPKGRHRTDEAIVFDVAPTGQITRVAVYLQRSVTTPA